MSSLVLNRSSESRYTSLKKTITNRIVFLRAALRLALLHLSGDRPTIQPPIPEREVDPAMLEEDRKAALKTLLPGDSALHDTSVGLSEAAQSEEAIWRGTRTGYSRPTLSSIRSKSQSSAIPTVPSVPANRPKHPLASSLQLGASVSSNPGLSVEGSAFDSESSDSDDTLVDSFTEKDVNDYLLSRTLTPNDVRQPQDLVRPLRGRMGNAAELIWILRPLLYGECHSTPCRSILSLTVLLPQCSRSVDGDDVTRLPLYSHLYWSISLA